MDEGECAGVNPAVTKVSEDGDTVRQLRDVFAEVP